MSRDERNEDKGGGQSAAHTPGQSDDPSTKGRHAKGREIAAIFSDAFNLLGALAAPRVLPQVLAGTTGRPVHAEFLAVLDRYIECFGDEIMAPKPRADAGEARPGKGLMRRLRAMLAGWQPCHPAPEEIVRTAREILAAHGMPGTDEEWDRWDGGRDEESADPHLRETPEERRRKRARVLRPEPITLEQWADLGEPGELVASRLVAEETTTPEHDTLVRWLVETLRAWAAPRGAWVFGPGHKLGLAPDLGRKPDISLYLPDAPPRGHGALSTSPPALVVEVLSPHGPDRLRAQHDKSEEYQRFGVRRYWMVYPEMEMIDHFLLGSDGSYVTEEVTSAGKVPGPGFEGLELDLDALWATAG
ncbi:uncharacterized protein SOCE26_057040 [Sorangium cellulosum]|uniref:Putative restriction endonuclease domain-containing protein n=1 Tax=Sorangium cellulosum TaxID=56 RepID=A0A2L0EY76_SORCE|nr:Uma2 family endonuclease [Sorangium cellulosum]AUX44240.1 uncharacterized protein SOCE26_057040 [Sorangium cellulosum]